jgi:DNA-binding response OmpR family regulator/flavodoxin
MEAAAKIMVVDDEKRICENIEKILAKNNYEVVSAVSADEALEKMATESFSLLISDIIMPGKNGLELLKLVKEEWPLTKAVMITAYASTDTAMKAIRMGALDYIPKPFTPDELRSTVEKALSGDLQEVRTTKREKEQIDIMDIDLPFDRDEVAKITGDTYADMLGPSDMPVVEVKAPKPLENFCEVGNMVCDIFKKLGVTCKAGVKTAGCPQKNKKRKKKKAAVGRKAYDARNLIGIDEPFDYQEVISVTGPEYVRNMRYEGVAFLPYEELKKNVSKWMGKQRRMIDVDMPFDADEVAKLTGETYTDQLSRSDVPVVEIAASEPLENFCEVGDMVCDIFKKLGATCKAGVKTTACPRKKAKKKRAISRAVLDVKSLVGIDLPFDYQEVAAAAGPEYARHLIYEDQVMIPYEELKANIARMDAQGEKRNAKVLAFATKSANKNILVIDDEVAVNNNIRKILQKNGYQVDQAVTKDEAMAKISHGDHPVILLDLKIPGVTGLELLAAIRSQRPDARVVMITGYASIETAVEAARMGVVEYLPKPFTPAEIRTATAAAFQMAA